MAHKSSHPIRRRFMAAAIAVAALSGAALPDDASEALAKSTDVHTVDEREERHHGFHPIKAIIAHFHH